MPGMLDVLHMSGRRFGHVHRTAAQRYAAGCDHREFHKCHSY